MAVLRVLHVLPHRGGGAETYVDLLERLPGVAHARTALSSGRSPAEAARTLAVGLGRAGRGARGADLVHVHGDAAACLVAPVLRGVPWVWTTHGLHLVRRQQGAALALTRTALRLVLASAAATICTSRSERDELAELAPEQAERLHVVRNGVELPEPASPEARATARLELGGGEGELCALYVGELHERKRPLDAVAAVEHAREDGAPVVLALVGSGEQAAAAQERIGPGVRVLGERDDVAALLAGADAFVLPSEREGLSFALLEAMGAGVAPVVSDAPGNAEAVGDAGIVVPRGDVAALAAALADLARRPQQARRLGALARQRVATELTAERLRAGVEAVYAAAR